MKRRKAIWFAIGLLIVLVLIAGYTMVSNWRSKQQPAGHALLSRLGLQSKDIDCMVIDTRGTVYVIRSRRLIRRLYSAGLD